MSDAIHGDDKSDHAESLSLQKSLYITCFSAAVGSVCFLAASFYIDHDEQQVKLYIQQHGNKQDGDEEEKHDVQEKEPFLSSHSDSEQSSIVVTHSVNNDQISQ